MGKKSANARPNQKLSGGKRSARTSGKIKNGDRVSVTSKKSGRKVGSKGTVVKRKGELMVKWDDATGGKPQPLNNVRKNIKKIRRRLVATPPACPSLPALPDMSPCVSTSVVLLIILPILYLLYVLVTRRTRAPKRRRSSRTATGLHASNPNGIYEPVEPYF